MASRKANKQGEYCDEGMLSHIMWWKEVPANSWYLYLIYKSAASIIYFFSTIWCFQKMEKCRKPSSVLLTQRLVYSNILGLDTALRNGRCICFMHAYPNYVHFLSFLERLTWCYHWHNTGTIFSLKDGTLNMEILQFKLKFPREVLLCRVCYYLMFH
jgi:hypothetical protein